ncbi:MAG: hypothetical protein CML44_03660 [Rhodobacteraceae bacterium]|nr:hypothetical protein [Paracoccaceae bacterium]|tara:strand:+ start:482 stop:1087 length:606 start_codon:yes stop_codon:yes gene_type:complete
MKAEKITDLIVVLKNHIPDETCDEILEWFKSNKHLQQEGVVYSTDGGKDLGPSVKKDFKNAIQTHVPPEASISDKMTDITISALREASSRYPVPSDGITLNDYCVRVYPKDEGIFKLHVDQRGFGTVSRLFACIMYLNDVKEGGETEFPDWNIAVRPEKGKVLLFPCNYLFRHKGNVPISEEKYIATNFINFLVRDNPPES